MKLNLFNGGLNTRVAQQHIGITQGARYLNIDSESGNLAAVRQPEQTGVMLAKDHVYFDAKNEWLEFASPVDTAEFKSVVYYADGINQPRKTDGVFDYQLGITAPTLKLEPDATTGVVLAPEPIVDVTTDVTEPTLGTALEASELHYLLINATGGLLSGALYLKVTAEGTQILAENTITPSYPVIVDVSDRAADLKVEFSDWAGFEPETITVYRLYDGKYYRVGFTGSLTGTITDEVYDISGNLELAEDNFADIFGVVQYTYTFYDSSVGTESGPSPISDEIDFGTRGGWVILGNVEESTDPQVDRIILYRIGGGLTEFSRVIDVPNGAISILDNRSNANIDGRIFTGEDNSTAPVGLKFLVEAYAMLFGAVGSRLYFTPIGEPDSWPTLFFLDFSFDITAVIPVSAGIIVCSNYRSEIVLGTGPFSLSRQPLSGDQGCISHKSVQFLDAGALWLSTDGLCLSSGGPVKVISKDMLGKRFFEVVDSALRDEIYYGIGANGLILAADFRYGLIFKEYLLGVEQLSVGADRLYGWTNGELAELFKSNSLTEFRYLSPVFFEGRATQSKLYKNMYFYYKGDIIIEVFMDDELAITKTLSSSGNYQVKIPNNFKSNHTLQLGIRGVGTVEEIYWEADANE